jgi:hypothetical protein
MDTGAEGESELAAAVAGRLGVPHTAVPGSRREFPGDFVRTVHLIDYQTVPRYKVFHTRLAEIIPAGGVVIDGNGGGFLKGGFNAPLLGSGTDWNAVPYQLFDYYAPPRFSYPALPPPVWDAIRAVARPPFTAELARFEGTPSPVPLSGFWTRTRRRVSPGPTSIYGDRHAVAMPMTAEGFIRATLAVPGDQKADGRFYRQVMELANPGVASLPSSNDPGRREARTAVRPTTSPAARRMYASLLARSPLKPWFAEELRGALARGKLGKRARRLGFLERMQIICGLTLWWERYEHRLRGFDPADLLGPPP